MPIRKGDLLLYTYDKNPDGHGALAVAIRDEYYDLTADESHRSVDINWISLAPALRFDNDDYSYNVDCFTQIGHIDVPKHPRRKKS